MADGIRVRPTTADDRPGWETLWRGYQIFYEVALDNDATEATWRRMHDPTAPIHGFVAEDADGVLVGMTNYVVHANTWFESEVIYLQDLYTLEDRRGEGIGRALIEAVVDRAKELGCGRVYWMTHETNGTARILYDKVAKYSGFLRYDVAL